MDKLESFQRYGKNDGMDEDRWRSAIQMAGEIDKSPSLCFERLIKLEDSGQIELVKGPATPPVLAESGTMFLDEQEKCLKVLIDGEMVKYPTIEEFNKLISLLNKDKKADVVQSLAQNVWKEFKTAWQRGDYKDKAITIEGCYLMGFQNGWDAREEETYKIIKGELGQ